jgi:hypothetical protein
VESFNWDLEVEPGGARVVVRGPFDEHADFAALAPEVARSEHVQFDLSGVGSINSWGARQWILFLRSLPDPIDYSFVAASVVFVKHCNMVADMLGPHGTLESFLAPFVCRGCGHGSERVLDAAVIARQMKLRQLPRFPCDCGGELELDDAPERFLAFLRLS